MPLKIAFQMDALSSLNYERDTTVVLALEAARRGYDLYHYEPGSVFWESGALRARGAQLQVDETGEIPLFLEAPDVLHLGSMDVIWMRQNPPFNMEYIALTHLLEGLPSSTLVVNDPRGVRDAPEKLLVTRFPELMPPTLITGDIEALEQFLEVHGEIVLKSLFDFGGNNIFHLQKGEGDFKNKVGQMKDLYPREPLMGQVFLPEVLTEGDKRIFLIEGAPVGCFFKRPESGKFLSNLSQGGRTEKADLTDRDREICAAIGPILKEMGLIFAGIDVIGGYLTEINVTCPTGIRALNALNGGQVEKKIWDAVLERKERE